MAHEQELTSVAGVLAESKNYRVEFEFESVSLLDKYLGRWIKIGDFYGDPDSAIIDRRERWVLMAGCGLILYYLRKPFEPYRYNVVSRQWAEMHRFPPDIWWTGSLRQISDNQVEFSLGEKTCILDTRTLAVRPYVKRNQGEIMKTGICPKCGVQDVRSGSGIKEKEKIALHTGEGVFGPLRKLSQYVCVNCGYVETYLEDGEGLAYIAEHWPRVTPE